MSTDTKQNSSSQEEFGLLFLSIKIGEFLKRLFLSMINLIGSAIIFLFRKWYYLASAVLITFVLAFILDKTLPSYYSSHLVIKSNSTHNQVIMTDLNKLGNYAKEQNYEALSEELKMTLDEASLIKEIQTYWYYDIDDDGIFEGIDFDRKFIADTSINKVDSVFVLRAWVYDPEILESLEARILPYLESNSYLVSINNQRLIHLEALLHQAEYEIEKLDSLQKREYYTNPDEIRQKEGQIVFTTENVVRIYHPLMFQLVQLKQEYERDLDVYRDVITIIEGFSTPKESVNGTTVYIKKLSWYFVGLALLFAIVIHYRKKIWGS